MIGLLAAILCAIQNIVLSLPALIVMGVNLMIAGLAAAITPLFDLLPEFPDPPTLPGEFTTALGWVAWVFPVQTAIAVMAFVVLAWLAWQALAIVLRWGKVISS